MTHFLPLMQLTSKCKFQLGVNIDVNNQFIKPCKFMHSMLAIYSIVYIYQLLLSIEENL